MLETCGKKHHSRMPDFHLDMSVMFQTFLTKHLAHGVWKSPVQMLLQ